VEHGSVERVLRAPQHPYTWGLLSSVPSLHGDADADLLPIPGNPPSLINLPSGCAFHPRCRWADVNGDRSRTEVPELVPAGEAGHLAACHLPVAARERIYRDEVAQVGVAR
ncbi:oligopeptide/dipeptide ABC transporter ATP-binding protein, partial [Micromonospora aurantiaca (nom. illeg.)]|uniref:oligopeptide/dipeptide ABC transporter ATP-binding protein n=2 Tax=Micromonospora TaxID=1873 RepID=UPI003650FB44